MIIYRIIPYYKCNNVHSLKNNRIPFYQLLKTQYSIYFLEACLIIQLILNYPATVVLRATRCIHVAAHTKRIRLSYLKSFFEEFHDAY